MFTKKFYVVATANSVRDVKVEKIYDGDVFTLDGIVAGLCKQLKGSQYQVSYVGDNAYIDITNQDDELEQTYSISSKEAFIKKPY